jgi:hypothetical protein
MSFCPHLVSVLCHPFTFHILIFSSENKSYLSFNSLGKSYLSFNRGEDFLEINQSETRIACGGRLLTDRDEMSNLYRGPSIDASYQVSVHLASVL